MEYLLLVKTGWNMECVVHVTGLERINLELLFP